MTSPTKLITRKELQSALSILKNNKAANVLKLTSEHFKLSIGVLDRYLFDLLSYMVRQSYLPHSKGRYTYSKFQNWDKSNPSNYRGITVTPVILKILEHVLNKRHNDILPDTQSPLQKGRTVGSSSMGEALILTK